MASYLPRCSKSKKKLTNPLKKKKIISFTRLLTWLGTKSSTKHFQLIKLLITYPTFRNSSSIYLNLTI